MGGELCRVLSRFQNVDVGRDFKFFKFIFLVGRERLERLFMESWLIGRFLQKMVLVLGSRIQNLEFSRKFYKLF